MKIGIKNNEFINSLALFAGIWTLILVIIVICLEKFLAVFAIVSIGGWESVAALIGAIKNALNYIVIDCETITLYRHKKPVKQINIADIKSLVLGQYVCSMLGENNPDKFTNSNKFIILNDGTLFNKKWTRRSFKKEILSETEGWIAIEFSAKRYAALKKLLPNCEIETCTIYDK